MSISHISSSSKPSMYCRGFSQDRWIEKTKNLIFSANAVNRDELIKALEVNPKLKECFEKDAGVTEGYTIKEHTLRVLQTFQKYLDTFLNKVTKHVTENEFLLFLALHDIGKGLAKEKQKSDTFTTSFSSKIDELTFTKDIMQKTLKELNIDDNKIDIFSSMLDYDTQGLLLQGHIHEDEAIDNILEMAKNCDLDPIDFYDLMKAFHISDAASYPSLSDVFNLKDNIFVYSDYNQTKVDRLYCRLEDTLNSDKIFNTLIKKVKEQIPQDEIRDYFQQNFKSIKRFLEISHRNMLSIENEDLEKNRAIYSKIKKDFRDLFVYLARDLGSPDLRSSEEKIKQYEKLISNRLGNDNQASFLESFQSFTDIFFRESWGSPTFKSIEDFIYKVMLFRRDFHVRFSLAKVKDVISKEMKTEVDKFEITDKNLDLLKITILHGTNSGILPNLLATSLHLIPTGRLQKIGVFPTSGELIKGGNMPKGVNQFALSGTDLSAAIRATDYAKGDFTKFSDDNEVEKELDKDSNNINGSYYKSEMDLPCYSISKLPLYIRKAKSLDPQKFEKEYKDKLIHLYTKRYTDLKRFEQTTRFKEVMPKAKDPTGEKGWLWHDNWAFNWHEKTKTVLEEIKKAIDEPVHQIPGILDAIKDPYPMLFASKTLYTTNYEEDRSERVLRNSPLIGTDIQVIFAKKDDIEKTKKFFTDQKNDVSVLALSDLSQAWRLHKLASPYFADFASRKRLEKQLNSKEEI